MKMLTIQEMTETQKIQVRTRLAQERKKLGRELTNSEQSKVRKQIITEISQEVEKQAKKLRAEKKKDKLVPSDTSYSWSSQNHKRGYR
ncbi:DUF3811 domain-containing protein [Providencia hangzhouensis]|mgnify:FL=1|uniref:DUF3811 domain-containing protein n=2 Tax=Providencia TaxID=586 RepID=A0A264W0I7_PRORE|nr:MULTISPECIES: DUF3811 domain-containing protein [Providencia]EHZ6872463.1 DUF3811 domain-containing protein [Providencia rettgeri]MBG5927303.1 DUF3811 domain-containing protein [Providencia rettgeri]MBJ9969418.1 DUF3811 domain-containing protein [Providencia rettgeri]MBN7840378.1 DUF3811 domain-containing protein [Providencia rettgeri]MBN7852962.1 DUF3811 domain-containing protein [Providencia rettgeri]